MERAPSVVFLNRFYWPDVAATGQMLADLAEDLAAAGWRVTVITSRTGYHADGGPLPREEVRNGVRILRVRATRFGRGKLAGRVGDYASYLAGAFLRLLRIPRPDLVVAMTDPPFLLAPALVAGRLRGARVAVWLQDLYPDLAARFGVLAERGAAYRLARAAARRLHRSADAVVTLGPAMSRAARAAGARPERTAHVHNWADADAVRPIAPEDNPFLDAHGLRGRFVVLYSGNAGRAHTFGAVLEAARRLRGDEGVVFLFVGGGPATPGLKDVAEREGLANVRFLDYLPRAEIRWSLAAAGASLVTEDPGVVGLLVPSKTYGILASGRPLLFVGSPESDVAEVVRTAEAGMVIAPDDAAGLVDAILRLRADPEAARRLGENARRAAERVYDRRLATAEWARTVRRLAWPAAEADARAAEPLAAAGSERGFHLR